MKKIVLGIIFITNFFSSLYTTPNNNADVKKTSLKNWILPGCIIALAKPIWPGWTALGLPVIVHEMGHAFAGKILFNQPIRITLGDPRITNGYFKQNDLYKKDDSYSLYVSKRAQETQGDEGSFVMLNSLLPNGGSAHLTKSVNDLYAPVKKSIFYMAGPMAGFATSLALVSCTGGPAALLASYSAFEGLQQLVPDNKIKDGYKILEQWISQEKLDRIVQSKTVYYLGNLAAAAITYFIVQKIKGQKINAG
ncbi:MAG: hypothetical protein WA432_03085 [Candidatus Babeliaceae bacterium]